MIENIKEDACFRLGKKYMFRVLSVDERTESSVSVSCIFLDVVKIHLQQEELLSEILRIFIV